MQNVTMLAVEQIHQVLKNLGFEFVAYQKDEKGNRNVTYRCICGNESQTDLRNLKKKTRTPHCPKCQNDSQKVDFTRLQQEFADRNCELLVSKEEYKNNKMRLRFRCACGSIGDIVYSDLKRGRLCGSCKLDRTSKTCLEKYGVDNPSKHPDVLRKIVQTNQERHGVSYPQQDAVIREKTERTSLERYGVKRAFCLPEVYQKIRNTHKEKYGVEFPFQSKEIQDKISLVFQRTLGADRPFLSTTFLKRMKETYGHEWFACTDRFKEIMLEKYGSEHYITSEHCKKNMLEKYGSEHYITSEHCKTNMLEKYGSEYYVTSEHYKQTMLQRYGVEHPMHHQELFRKAQQCSSFRRPYISWDGKVFMVLGYEDIALDGIFQEEGCKMVYAGEDPDIPSFQYIGKDDNYHYYYPDFYIPHENRVIEVKSVYIYNRDPESMLHKALAVSESHLFE